MSGSTTTATTITMSITIIKFFNQVFNYFGIIGFTNYSVALLANNRIVDLPGYTTQTGKDLITRYVKLGLFPSSLSTTPKFQIDSYSEIENMFNIW